MTVKELIEYLSRVKDKNKEVIIEINDFDDGYYARDCRIVYSAPEYPDSVFISDDLANIDCDEDRTIFSEKNEEKG